MAYDQQLADALAENADLRRWKAMDKPLTAAMAVVVSDVQKLRAEIKRLRAALKEIRSLTAKHDLPDAWKIADRALTHEQNVSGEVDG